MKIKWASVSCVLCVCESIIKALNQRDNVRSSRFQQERTMLPASGSIAAKDKRLRGHLSNTLLFCRRTYLNFSKHGLYLPQVQKNQLIQVSTSNFSNLTGHFFFFLHILY